MEERRLILAVALSLLVVSAYSMLFPARPRPKPVPPAGAPAATAPAGAATGAPEAVPAPAAPAPEATPLPRVVDELERRVEVVAPETALAFTNKGAGLLSFTLSAYHDERGKPEEMVPTTVPGSGRPLEIETGDPAVDKQLRQALFVASAESVKVDPGRPSELVFRYADGGLEAEKRFRFGEKPYLIEAAASVRKGGRELPVHLLWGPGLRNPTERETEVSGYQPPQLVFFDRHGVERVAAAKMGTRQLSEARWVGVESQYFAALWVPRDGRPVDARAVKVTRPGESEAHDAPAILAPVSADAPALLFVGPKDHSLLAGLGSGLAEVVDTGSWIGPIVVPLMALLRWVHAHVGNYGWSIVAMTVLINLVMAPFRHYSIANGIKMAKLGPEMRVIQDRYRKVPLLDPKRQVMQEEIGALYARHGVNMSTQMLVGCLPLLITMPFFFAFYRMLQVSIDLRGAPFLWIPDLSHKDPLYLTPILMAATMVITTRLTPTTADPAQQKMMMFMPLMIAAFLFAAPAGVNVYWLSSNLCSIVQQSVTLKLVGDPKGDRERKKG